MSVIKATPDKVFSCGRRKEYLDGSYELMLCTRPVFRVPGWEDHFERKPLPEHLDIQGKEVTKDLVEMGWVEPEAPKGPDPDNIKRAARRAVVRVRDLALSNHFDYFVTLTLDAERVDRYDIAGITRKLNSWLKNQVQRRGLRYIIVPELHQDGAYHFHGLINDCGGMTQSGTWIIPGHKKPVKARSKKQAEEWARLGPDAGYKEVFNWERWPLGFSTAIRLYGDYHAVVGYVSKYITKQIRDSSGKIAGRWYFSGGDLQEPDITYPDISPRDTDTEGPGWFNFEVPEARAKFSIFRSDSTKTDCSAGPEPGQGGGEAGP